MWTIVKLEFDLIPSL